MHCKSEDDIYIIVYLQQTGQGKAGPEDGKSQ